MIWPAGVNINKMRHMTRRFGYLLILTVLLLNCSCVNRDFIDGRSELISVSDTSLNDSALFYGNITRVDWTLNYPYPGQFEIWIEDTDYRMNSGTGYYSLKVSPGTYSIKCQEQGNSWSNLIEEMKNVKIEKNKKIQIDFYIGYASE
jgi:hypothetical protein